jgi:hypothetical protein
VPGDISDSLSTLHGRVSSAVCCRCTSGSETGRDKGGHCARRHVSSRVMTRRGQSQVEGAQRAQPPHQMEQHTAN